MTETPRSYSVTGGAGEIMAKLRVAHAKPGQVHASFAGGFLARTDDGKWLVTAEWADTGPVAFRNLTIQPYGDEDEYGVTSTVLQRLPIGRWLAYARDALAKEGVRMSEHARIRQQLTDEQYETLIRSAERLRRKQRPPRRAESASIYRRLAETYLEVQATEGTRGINRRVAELIGEGEPVPEGTFRDWLRRATELGYLGPGQRGRAGRMPGPALTDDEGSN